MIELIDSREEGSSFIIGGDVNGDLGSSCGTRSPRIANERGSLFLEVVNRYNMTVCNLESLATCPVNTFNGPTGSSTIDFICIQDNMADTLLSCSTSDNDPLNNLDHEAV